MDKNIFEGIKYFISVAKLGSINLVSKELNIDYKTITQKILYLEGQTKKKLIDSNKFGTTLTQNGWEFYHQILDEFNDLSTKYIKYIDKNNCNANKCFLNLLLPPATSVFFSLYIMPGLYKKFPELSVNISSLNIKYMLNYGSHIKSMLNKFNMIYLDNLAYNLINQDDWNLALTSDMELKLYASPEYIQQKKLNSINDLNSVTLIAKSGTSEELGPLLLNHHNTGKQEKIKINKIITAESELIKLHLTNKGLGISALSNMILICAQDVNLVEIFPEYKVEYKEKFSLIYKKDNIDKKYTDEIIKLAKATIFELKNQISFS